MPAVNPKILTWARETAGLSLEAAAKGIQLSDAYGKTGAERLRELESGQGEPSERQLELMSQKYRRPLIVFYLNEPPPKGDRGQDFRTLPGEKPAEYDPELDALLRDLKVRQNIVRSLLEDEDAEKLSFVGSVSLMTNHVALAERIVSTLQFKLESFRGANSPRDAFAYLRHCVENIGVFVLLMGDLGNHLKRFSVATFRGIALADSLAPFIVINSTDLDEAKSFTILHELAHIFLGQTGISGGNINEAFVEQLCNNVAGDILLPTEDLKQFSDIGSMVFSDIVLQLSEFANGRNLSRAMVAYKLFKSNKIQEGTWISLRDTFERDWRDAKARKKDLNQAKAGGPSYYVIQRYIIGTPLIDLVGRSISEGTISPTKASKILGVKPISIDTLLNTISS